MIAGEVVTVGAFESASASPNFGELSKFAEFRKAPSTFQLSSDFVAFFLISESAMNFPTFAVSLLTQPSYTAFCSLSRERSCSICVFAAGLLSHRVMCN